MDVRESLHRRIDAPPEDGRLTYSIIWTIFKTTDDALRRDSQAVIEEGLADIREDRTISLAEYRRTRNL